MYKDVGCSIPSGGREGETTWGPSLEEWASKTQWMHTPEWEATDQTSNSCPTGLKGTLLCQKSEHQNIIYSTVSFTYIKSICIYPDKIHICKNICKQHIHSKYT